MSDFEKALGGLEAKLDSALQSHTAEVEKYGKASTELTKAVDELSQKHADVDAKLREIAQKQDTAGSQMKAAESLGSIVLKDEGVQAFLQGKGNNRARVEVKNTILGEGGSPQNPVDTIVAPDRRAGIVPGAFRPLNILDVIPTGSTTSNQVEYTQEDTWTNDAAETAEAAAKPESDLTFKLVQEPVRTIAHWIKLSKQVLDDAPALESYVNRRLTHGLRNRLEAQILKGTGTSPNLAGLSASGRHVAFNPVTGENQLDSVNRAKYQVTGNDFMANAVFINPADWGHIERLKRATGDDGYVISEGNGITYIANGAQPMLWGLPVIASNNVTQGKFYVLDTNAIELMIRQSVEVEMGFINDDFTKNLFTLRAEMRGALAVFQPSAVTYGDLVV